MTDFIEQATADPNVVTMRQTAYLRNNVQAWEMQPDGSYRRRAKRRANAYSAQAELRALLTKRK